jgi:hypothetical protein
MKRKEFLSLGILLLLFSGCGSAESPVDSLVSNLGGLQSKETGNGMDNDESVSAGYEEQKSGDGFNKAKQVYYSLPSPAENALDLRIPEKIIKTADLNIEVEEYRTAIKEIRSKIKKSGAYISSENENNSSNYTSNIMTIRVPSENLEKLLDDLSAGVQRVDSKTISSDDVTAEYVDIASRLKTKKEVEARYLDLLKKAGSITDILEVEEKLRVIREEIEATEGRLKLMNDQASLSTINLNVYEKYSDVYEPGFFTKAGEGLSAGWEGLKVFMIAMVYLWPLWLILITGLWILFRILKKRKIRKALKKQQTQG